MNYYFAPMEGITGYTYRRVHHRFFSGADRYYTPFLSANHNYSFQNKELRDTLPENNEGIPLVPQLLTKKAAEFDWGARTLAALGYREVNFNLGCPSATVSAKGKGAGFLRDPDALERFFEELFNRAGTIPPYEVSVKIRLGYASPAEAERLISILNRYPLCEVIVHARVREQMYKGRADLDGFSVFYENCVHSLCYNGDLGYPPETDQAVFSRFPNLPSVMVGRGVISDPAYIRKMKGGAPLSKEECLAFLNALLDGYMEQFHGDERIAVGHMKEVWYYLIRQFPGRDKEHKAICKAMTRAAYEAAQARIFSA